MGIIPRGVFVSHTVDDKVIVVSGSLPGANGGVVARLEELPVYRFGRKILIPFDNHAGVALRNQLSSPTCFRHSLFLQPSLSSKRAGSADIEA